MTNVPAPKCCSHCGKQRGNSFTATLPNNTLSTNTYAPPFVSAMGWNAVEPFLPVQFTQPTPLILTCEELCACTLEMLDEKLEKAHAERDSHIYPIRLSDTQWAEMRQYVAERIAAVFQITMEELGITKNKE